MKRIIFILAFVLFCTEYVFAQTASFVAFSPDASSVSMGLTGVASKANSFANFNNSSATVFSQKTMDVSLMYAKWQPDFLNNTFIGAAGFYKINDNMVFDFGYRKFGYPSYDVFNEDGTLQGNFEPSEMSISLGLGYKLSEKLAVSADFNYLKSEIAKEANASAVAVDLGLTYRMDSIFRLGAKIDNLGSKLDNGNGANSLPTNITAGVAYDYFLNSDNYITALFDMGYIISYSQLIAGVGVEYCYKQQIKPRLGYHYGDKTKGIPSFFSAGLGLNYFNVSFDFAYIIAGGGSSVLNNSMSIGLGYSF